VRFKPRVGQFLAAPTGSVVSLFDVETDRQQMHTFQVLTLTQNFRNLRK